METNDLDQLDKAAIVGIAIIIILIVLAITACFVVPGCLGYACLHKKEQESDEILMIERAKKKFSIKLNENQSPVYQSVAHLKAVETQDNYENVNRSLFNGNYTPTFLPVDLVPKQTIVKVLLTFSNQQDVTELGRLLLQIIEATNVPERDYPVLPDTTIKAELIPKRFSLNKIKPVHEVQTRLIRSTRSPVFEQRFVLAAGSSELKSWTLKISVIDEDKSTRSRVTCRGKIHLRHVKNLTSGEEIGLELNLEPILYDHGQLLIALSYLPTSQRLSASVIKANKLQWTNLVKNISEFRPCVKVALLDHNGKYLKKKKIWGDSGTDSPSFNGSICFQISPAAYETATLIFVLSSEKEQTGMEETKKTDILGYAALGWIVKEESGREHWHAVLQTPRKIISQWHTLR